jgi:ribosome-binding factor A
MPKEFSRVNRVADFLKQELAQLIRFEIKDPRLTTINITDAEVSRDLGHAKIFFTVIGNLSEAEGQKAAEVLNRAAGFLRKQLAEANTMRTTPQLHFHYDQSVIRGGQLASLIDEAVAKDKSHHHE